MTLKASSVDKYVIAYVDDGAKIGATKARIEGNSWLGFIIGFLGSG